MKNSTLIKLFGLRWQEAPSKEVPGKYRIRFPEGTTLGQCQRCAKYPVIWLKPHPNPKPYTNNRIIAHIN